MSATPKFVSITPTQAVKLLEAHQAVVEASGLSSLNRIINDNTVTQYGNDMANHKWVENGESIKIAKSGRILDGQHRLWACVNATATFKTLLVTGFEDNEVESVFVTTDIGRVKIPSAFLSASGVGYGGMVAPAIRYILGYKQHATLNKQHMFTTPQVVEYGRAHTERLVDSAAFVAKYQGYAPTSILTAWHYLFFEKNQEEAAQFIIDLKDGSGLNKGDPVHAMRERLIQNKGNRATKMSAKSIFAMGLHMWNDRRKNVTRTVIKQPQLEYGKLPKLV
jgi:hypothetical protein